MTPPPRTVNVQLRPSREVEVHKRALEALVPELQTQHSLHMGVGGADTAQRHAQGSMHHGLAPLSGEVACHLLLKGRQVKASFPSPLQDSLLDIHLGAYLFHLRLRHQHNND